MSKILSLYLLACIFVFITAMAFLLPNDGYIDYQVYNICLTTGGFPGTEPAMGWVCSITSNFTESVAILLPRIMSLALLLGGVWFFTKKFDIYTGLFFLYINGFQTLGAYRQGTAVILLCFAVYFLVRRHTTRFNILSLGAFLFHFSTMFAVFLLWARKYGNLWISGVIFALIFFIELILGSALLASLIPQIDFARYVNLSSNSLPTSSYFELGKVWYILYYSYFIIISFKFYEKNKSNSCFSEFSSIYIAFIPIILAVPTLTLMDSWAATRVSSLTNCFELIFFGMAATNLQRLFMFIAYFVRTTIAYITFFVM